MKAECAMLLVAVAPGLWVSEVEAQTASTVVPATLATRVGRAPVIDGRLDDGVWGEVPVLTEFFQQEPVEGAEASEPTRVQVAYDDTGLYFGITLLDRAPSLIRASELRRDDTLESDDSFAVLLDTYHDHRNAFLFRINPRGTRFDGLIRDESRFVSSDWDEQWTAAATVTETGWSAEIAVPFKILRFSGAAEQTWGLNFERVIKRKNELAYWAGWDRDFGFFNVSQAGHLANLRDVRPAERIRLRPYVLTGAERLDAVSNPTGTERLGEIGIDDLKIAVTSNLTADLAVNPDFAQTEVDAQRVNLTRFSLFFPEKRQFFVEGANSFRMGVGLLHFGPPPLELFYSRRIGLSSTGGAIPVTIGGKLTGKAAGFEVGMLGVRAGAISGVEPETFSVGRVRKELLGRSYVGAILTDRQGGGTFNRVAGADARFVFLTHLRVMGLLARSFDTDGIGDQWARQAGADWRSDVLELGVNYLDIDSGFDPGLGFLRRTDRMVGARVSVRPRPGGALVRQLEVTPSLVYFHDDEQVLRTREAELRFVTAFESGDRLQLSLENALENLPRPFAIGPGVTLPIDRYEWNSASLNVRTFNGRAMNLDTTLSLGGFYNGTKRTVELSGEYRPNQNLSLIPSYAFNDIDLREGAFDTHLVGLRANVSFTRSWLTSAFLQYNSTGDLAALQLRLNYIFRTIDNLYIVYNESKFTGGVFSDHSNRSLVTKLTYSLHR